MLSISSKTRYGIAAMLALTDSYGSGLLQIKDISSRCNIPHQYLEQIFNRLGKAGIIKSTRGKNGGYELASGPRNITVLDILYVLEGGIEFVPKSPEGNDIIYDLFKKADIKLQEILNISLAELAERQQTMRNNVTYHI
jgi:Rrf2 family protein